MPYYVISNFASGRDLRRSAETAPSGSLRVLRNAFINEGGEIEKRKAFVRQEEVTEFARDETRRGTITGPHICPNCPRTVFFRHRGGSRPGAPFTAGSEPETAFYSRIDPLSGRITHRFWTQASALALASGSVLMHARTSTEFASDAYLVESFLQPDGTTKFEHVYVEHTASEPTDEDVIADNDGRPAQYILKSKNYVGAGNTLFASAVGDPTDMTTGAGFGAVDLTTQSKAIGQVVAIAEYFGQIVVFGRRGMMFWSVDPDFAQNQYLRSIEGSIFAARSATGYSNGDVLYLTRGGVRSLQARDSSNEARVSDVGSPIDTDIRRSLESSVEDAEPVFSIAGPEVPNAQFYHLATGIVHHDSGQFWLALKDRIHVLSRYPSAKVLAWSTFDLPLLEDNSEWGNGDLKGRWVADWCVIGETVIFRNFNDEIYIYGGYDDATYDDSEVEVILPFMDMGRPGTVKKFTGMDLVCEGKWDVEFTTKSCGEDRPERWVKIGEIDGNTRSIPRVFFQDTGTHIAFRLTTRDVMPARIGEIVVHYQEGAQK